ncbi:MAG TPA: hypothetical protein VG742_19100 [Dongiaceae bacterium]|jgi:hypothetical protein|nr:hypothetical protein [Dongiaceae bacterium]
MFGKHSWLGGRQAILGAAALVAIVAVNPFQPHSAQAEEAFGGAVAVDELANIRGGDNTATDSFNETNTSASSQTTSATNENNSIGGDAPAGSVFIQSGAMTGNRGMTNNVMNTAPQSNVQGIMSLNVILH